MSVWKCVGYDTGAREDRYRIYTASAKRALLWEHIPRIDFTDSGHGIVFTARQHSGKRQPERRVGYDDHPAVELRRLEAEWKAARGFTLEETCKRITGGERFTDGELIRVRQLPTVYEVELFGGMRDERGVLIRAINCTEGNDWTRATPARVYEAAG